MPRHGTYRKNDAGDGYLPVCKCGQPYGDAHIGEVKNYPDDGVVAVFFTCETCKEECQFTCPTCRWARVRDPRSPRRRG